MKTLEFNDRISRTIRLAHRLRLPRSRTPPVPVPSIRHPRWLKVRITRSCRLKYVTCSWFEQHRRLAKLNLQAHQSAMARSDEYVLEALLTFDKLSVVVHELLAIEAWKEVSARQDLRCTITIAPCR